uniref:Sulfatase N-terminal domain-containing protein n=1 Tax=Strigamia maritima TaxID=126957 RepID=T1IX37_STRMM
MPPAFTIFILSFSLLFGANYCQIERPHVIFILADDLGWNDVSFHGSPQIPTTNIDKLASEGIILNNYYVSPLCTPSRSSLMTGKYPIHTGMQHDVIYGPQPYGLPLQLKLLPEYFKDLGYVNRIVGKWHLGFFHTNYTPTARGFDSHFGYFCGHQDYFDHTAQETNYDWGLDMRNGSKLMKSLFGQYSTTLFTHEAVRLIDSHNSSESLFLYLAHLAVHAGNSYAPLQAPKKYVSRFPHIKNHNRRIFAGMTAALDDSIGDTKNTLWEGGVRASGFVWSLKLEERKRVSSQLMHISDWLPTLYHAVGGDTSELPSDLDGFNMWPSLNNNSPSPRKAVLHNIDDLLNIAALRYEDFKVVIGRTFDGKYDNWFPLPEEIEYDSNEVNFFRSHSFINLKNATVFCGPVPQNASENCQPQLKPCLFNIKEDPCEFHNLALDKPDVLQMLLDKLNDYNSTAVPPVNKPDDPRANPRLHGYAWVPWINTEM